MGRVENIVEKGENAGYQHFLLFPHCFQKASFSRSLKVGIVWLRVNFIQDKKILDRPKLKAFTNNKLNVTHIMKFVFKRAENIVGKGNNAFNQHFLLLPQLFKKPSISNRIHSSLTAVCCFDNSYVGKQPVACKEYCAEYWLKELQESINRYTGSRNITEILLKMVFNTIQSISSSLKPGIVL